MKPASRFAQQRAIGRILHQGMFEQICRMGRDALPEQQASLNETVESRVEFPLRLAHHRSQQFMRELSPYGSSDLAYLLGRRADPVEPRHERSMQACWVRQR